MGEGPWHPPAVVAELFSEAEPWYSAELGTWQWERRCDPARGGMLMHCKLFPIGGVICLMLCGGSSCLQVNLVGAASLWAI